MATYLSIDQVKYVSSYCHKLSAKIIQHICKLSIDILINRLTNCTLFVVNVR
jgi:hypothetical protein